MRVNRTKHTLQEMMISSRPRSPSLLIAPSRGPGPFLLFRRSPTLSCAVTWNPFSYRLFMYPSGSVVCWCPNSSLYLFSTLQCCRSCRATRAIQTLSLTRRWWSPAAVVSWISAHMCCQSLSGPLPSSCRKPSACCRSCPLQQVLSRLFRQRHA